MKLHQTKFINSINKFFKIGDRQSTIKKELIGGLSTFLAMMYILAVNPAMLSTADGINVSQTQAEAGIFLGTALSAFIATFIMGLFANVPMVLAPGMGLNAYFTFTVASSQGFGLGYYQSLVCVFISGILYAILAITPARKKLTELLPSNIKTIIIVMIGFFLSYVGLVNIGIVSSGQPATTIGENFKSTNQNYPIVIIGTISMIIGIILFFCNVKRSIIITSLLSLMMLLITWLVNPEFTKGNGVQAFALNNYGDFSAFGKMFNNFFTSESWSKALSNPGAYIAIFTFLYVDFFDTSGTLFAIGKSSNLIDENDLAASETWMKRANYVDAIGTISGAMLLNSSVTVVSESEAAVRSGARTGLSAILTSLMLLLSLAIWPIMGPFMPIGGFQPMTGHAIFLTGILMISNIRYIDFSKYLDIPVLAITIIFGMLGYSISAGISWCILFYVLIQFINSTINLIKNRKVKDISKSSYYDSLNWLLYVMFVLSILFIIFDILTKSGIFNIA